MTSKQRAFAEHIINGETLVGAYRRAYPASLNWKGDQAKKEAWKAAQRPAVKNYIAEAQAAVRAAATLTREDLLLAMGKIVKRVGKDANAPATAVVAATQQASRMLGCDAPTKIEMKVEGSLLYRIRKASAK